MKGKILVLAMVIVCFLFLFLKKDRYKEEFDGLHNRVFKSPAHEFVDLANVFSFEWDKVCFDSATELSIRFKHKEEELLVFYLDEDRFIYREDYVDRSPANRCFPRNQVFRLEGISVLYNPIVVISVESEGGRND